MRGQGIDMVILILVSIILLVIFSLVSLINILLGPDLKKGKSPENYPKLSVLIPARNEENNIATCLKSILKQNYPDYEVIVLDDESKDRTAEIVNTFKSVSNRVRLVQGAPLPSGWLGKNWACRQLADQAKGQIFIFTDADTWHDPDALRNTVGWMAEYELDGLSVFSQQVMKRFSERLMVPWIDLILYTLLPLWTVYRFPFRSLAAANGQWIAVTREAYRRLDGHTSVRNELVEDVALFRRAKELGLSVMTLAGTNMIYCRMYRNMKQIWSGFTKILFGLTGNHVLTFLFFLAFILTAYVYPCVVFLIDPGLPQVFIAVSLILLVRIANAWHFRHPLAEAVFLHPVSAVILAVMAVHSFVKVRWGTVTWKERSISLSAHGV